MRADIATTELETANVNAEKISDLAISSQALQECSEGSTTRSRSPERTVKTHERAATKTCKVCKEVKTSSEFSYGKRTCKKCRCTIEAERYLLPEVAERQAKHRAAYYPANQERILKQKSEYGKRADVAAREKKNRRDRYARDPSYKARVKNRHDRYYGNNAHVFRARDAKRRALQQKAMPVWADKEAIKLFYKDALQRTQSTGVEHEVDHIIPLTGRTVCGLHVETNLRVITASENRKKFNLLVEDIV